MSFEGGYQSDVVISAKQGGAVFITNIEAQETTENVASKVFSSDGLVLQSCSSSTDLITVSILAITGFSSFKPIVMIGNEQVNLVQDEDQNVWTGDIDIDLGGNSMVEVIHNDGAFHRCMILSESNPVISDAFLTGGYPNGQTELKEFDRFSLQVESAEVFSSIEIADYGAAKAETFQFDSTSTHSVDIVVADRGNTPNSQGVKLRIVNQNGTKSDWYLTESNGNENGKHTVILNNLYPTINIQAISYPENQLAIKNEEKASIIHSIENFDSIDYESKNEQLSIVSPNSYSAAKEVSRIAGDYNLNQSNLTITAKRSSNGAETSENVTVKIAHIAASITFDGIDGRLVSGGNNGTEAQNHSLIISSNQALISLPIISVPEGSLQGEMQAIGDSNNYQQHILIHDDDEKGIHTAVLVEAINLAGIVTNSFTGQSNYEIGGFVQRTLSFLEFTNEAQLGTAVTDVSKLIAKDKDERLMTYVNSLNNAPLTYTITKPSNVINPQGDLFHWNDEQAVNNNSTGLATVLIEELP